MQKSVKFVLGAYYAILIGLPVLVFAQQGAAAPSRLVPCDGVNCSVCDLATLAQNIINLGVFLFVFLAAIMFAYAGFLYLTDASLHGQSQAKSMFGHVAGGLVILLSAWLIVDTLMKSMLGGNFGPWNNICSAIGM